MLLTTLAITSTTLAEGIPGKPVDAVTTTNVKVVGTSPAMAMSQIYVQTQPSLFNGSSTACHVRATAVCLAVQNNGKILEADENGLTQVAMPGQYAGFTCMISGCDGSTPMMVSINSLTN
jgi:hypothetical protein